MSIEGEGVEGEREEQGTMGRPTDHETQFQIYI